MPNTDFQNLQEQRAELVKALGTIQGQINKGGRGDFDIHHPERSPDWQRYQHQEYPRMVYHPVKLDPKIETLRLGLRRRNEANPALAPLDLPASKPLYRIVQNAEELKAAEEQGFCKTPPAVKLDPEAEVFDPLAESVGPTKSFSKSKR